MSASHSLTGGAQRLAGRDASQASHQRRRMAKNCPRCDKPIPKTALKTNERFRCPSCGARLRIRVKQPRTSAGGNGASSNASKETTVATPSAEENSTLSDDLRTRPKIGPYRLLAELGRGGMGKVYKAYHEPTGEIRALKVLKSDAARSRKVIARFAREAKACRSIDHPHIVKVYEFARDPVRKCYYMAMEYLERGSVSQLIRAQGRLPWPHVVQIAKQVASALDELQRRGLVHRDIKPSNLLIDRNGNVKLADMGLVRYEGDDEDDHQLTTTGAVMGTLDYMAPEQIVDPRNTDIRSDLYSLGCTLFHMLAGQPPFPDGNAYQKIQQHLSHPLPEIGLLAPDVPSPLALILNRLTAKDPADRFQTPAQLLAALEALEKDMRNVPSSGAITVPEELRHVVAQAAEESTITRHQRRWRDLVLPGLITALIAGAVLIVLAILTGGGSKSEPKRPQEIPKVGQKSVPRLPDAPFSRH